VGLHQELIAKKGWALSAAEALALPARGDVVLVDLREKSEREKYGVIPGSLHAPYRDLPQHIAPGGTLHELAVATDKPLIFYCAFGERSAMAVQAAQDAGLASTRHIQGGIAAWKKANGPISR
jgi:rhodanese-related sulfurtransferase